MNYTVLTLGILFLTAYFFISVLIGIKMYFKNKDSYNDDVFNYPRHRPDWVPKEGFLIDMHSHTSYSDGLLTPRQSVLWHISNGYDGMVVSDHNTMDGIDECIKEAKIIDPNFLIIPGIEFTSMKVHLNLIGIKSLMPKPNMIWTRKSKIIKAIEHAHKEDGVIQFNHKHWYFHKRYLPKKWYLEHGIDGFEVYNGFREIKSDLDALDFIEKNKDKKILFASAGTDIHEPPLHFRAYTEILTDDRSVGGIINALKEGKTKIYMDEEKEKLREVPEKGKKIVNKKREKLIKKYLPLVWIPLAFTTNKAKRVLAFIILSIAFIVILSSVL